jgi:hypothetical protein
MNRQHFMLLWIMLSWFSLTTVLTMNSEAQNFPPLEVTIHDSTATQGYYFIAPYAIFYPFTYSHPQLILDQYGRVIYSRVFSGIPVNNSNSVDFKLHDNGVMSYFSWFYWKFYLMDSTFTVYDSLIPANGFSCDSHDLLILPNGNFMMMAKESRFMDLSSYHWFGFSGNQPGSTNAEVIGVVIQEFDENKNLVWEWKGHDHFDFEDVDPVWLSNPNKVDWTHSNAIEVDTDGNIFLCSRHFNEITKINRQTSEIIWRMGGKANQFTFTNDTLWFNGQHDIRRLTNGNVTLYDNGKYHNPPLARALEYMLDESNLTATLVWEYFYDSTSFSNSMGNFQTLENGNRVICFGTVPDGLPWMVVVKPDKSVIMEIDSPGSIQSYRAFNYETLPWPFEQPQVDCYKAGDTWYLEAEPGHSEYLWSNGATTQSIPITFSGEYWVSVPHGEGNIRSQYISVNDPQNPCLYLDAGELNGSGAITMECSPNPVQTKASIEFYLPRSSRIKLILVNLQGKTLLLMNHGILKAGLHSVQFDRSGLSSGIYLLRLHTNDSVKVKKILVH